MSFGIGSFGPSSWGGSDFLLTNQVPSNGSVGNSRLPVIAFLLVSNGNAVDGYSINVTANGVPLIVDGYFQPAGSGTIDLTDPNNVQVTIQVTHAYQPLSIVTVVVSALNSSGESLSSGTSWQFGVDDTVFLFKNYIVRKYQRVFVVGAGGGLTPPLNAHAVVELSPPGNFVIEII